MVSRMTKVIRWTSLFVALTFMTALLEPWLIQWLGSIGWYDDPVTSVPVLLRELVQLVGSGPFPWVGGLVFGFTSGVWVDFVVRRRGQKYDDRLRQLYRLSARLRGKLLKLIENNQEQLPRELYVELHAYALKLTNLNVPVYIFSSPAEWYVFIAYIAPLIRDGELRYTRRLARRMIPHIRRQTEPPTAAPSTEQRPKPQ